VTAVRLPNTPIAAPWPTLPTCDQARHIAQLRRLAGPDTTVDVTPVPETATRACSRAWADGPGLFRLTSGEVVCLRCVGQALRLLPYQTAARGEVEVLRAQMVPWQQMALEDTGGTS